MEKTRCPLSLVVVLKIYFFVLFNFTAEYVICSLFSKNAEKNILQFDLQKKNFVKTSKIYRNIYRKNLSAIIYRSSISLEKIEINDYRYRPGLF